MRGAKERRGGEVDPSSAKTVWRVELQRLKPVERASHNTDSEPFPVAVFLVIRVEKSKKRPRTKQKTPNHDT